MPTACKKKLTMPTSCKKMSSLPKNPEFDPDRKNVVITKLFAPKFCAEWSNRELHSSHGDPFREKSKEVQRTGKLNRRTVGAAIRRFDKPEPQKRFGGSATNRTTPRSTMILAASSKFWPQGHPHAPVQLTNAKRLSPKGPK